MRVDKQIIQFVKQGVVERKPEAKVYLFGSRTSDDSLGGDIDILILSDNLIERSMLRSIRIDFYQKFGWQKIDLVNFTFVDNSVFKQLILSNVIEL